MTKYTGPLGTVTAEVATEWRRNVLFGNVYQDVKPGDVVVTTDAGAKHKLSASVFEADYAEDKPKAKPKPKATASKD